MTNLSIREYTVDIIDINKNYVVISRTFSTIADARIFAHRTITDIHTTKGDGVFGYRCDIRDSNGIMVGSVIPYYDRGLLTVRFHIDGSDKMMRIKPSGVLVPLPR